MRFSNLPRRDFLRLSLFGVAGGVLSPFVANSPWLRAVAGTGGPRKMLVIFLRGGNDGVNTCIPFGDSAYSATARPGLFIPPDQALDLNGFAALHPALGPLHELHLAGDLATIHRVAYADQSRSHFDSQQFWETGVPGDGEFDEGWLYRQVVESYDLSANPIAGASIANRALALLHGETALPHIVDLATYDLDAPGTSQAKLLGDAPSAGGEGSGLLGWYGRDAASSHGYRGLLATTAGSLGASLAALEAAGVDPTTYQPAGGATYPNEDEPLGFPPSSFPFFRNLRDAAQLLKQTELRVAAVEIEGFDTHAAQGATAGPHATLLATIAHGIRSISLDLHAQWDDTLVVTLSEFGRTSEENGSGGTDHGEASCIFVAGGGVQGGVYNCDDASWSTGDIFSTPDGRYVAHLTDYRAVLREILDVHFGLAVSSIAAVLPGIDDHVGDPQFDSVGFLP